jgi:hypothetical protein
VTEKGIEIETDVSIPPRGVQGNRAKNACEGWFLAKPKVRIEWETERPAQVKGTTAFVEKMLAKYPEIKAARTIIDWIAEWSKQK